MSAVHPATAVIHRLLAVLAGRVDILIPRCPRRSVRPPIVPFDDQSQIFSGTAAAAAAAARVPVVWAPIMRGADGRSRVTSAATPPSFPAISEWTPAAGTRRVLSLAIDVLLRLF